MTITAEDIIERFNKHPRKNEIINDFNKNWAKRAKKRAVDAGLKDKKDLVAGYHYFECPITGIGHLSYKNAYFNRISDICTKEEFEEAFFSVEGLDKAPYQAKNFSATWQQNNANKHASKPKYGTKTVKGHVFDMDHYYDVYDKNIRYLMTKNKQKAGVDWIEGYAYFNCPVSGLPVSRYGTKVHLRSLNLTKDEFFELFPECDIKPLMSPRDRGISIGDFNNGKVEKKPRSYKPVDHPNGFEIRYMHITDKDDYLSLISKDEYTEPYKRSRGKIDKEIESQYPNGIVGIDYCICPVFGHKYYKFNRTSLKYYGITWERLMEWFGDNFIKTAESHCSKISNSLNEELEDGSTPHGRAIDKAKITKNIVGDDGLTINERVGKKTKATHLSKLDDYGRNGFHRGADNDHWKRMETRYGDSINLYYRRERYERIIELMTNRCRGLYDYLGGYNIEWSSYRYNNNPNAMQLDHKFSRHEGYNQKISPVCIGHFHNLEYMKAKDNFKKKNDCSITVQELATINHMTVKDMEDEFDKIMAVIDDDIANGLIHNSMNVLIRAGHSIALKIKPYNMLKHTCESVEMDKQTKDIIISDIITKL